MSYWDKSVDLSYIFLLESIWTNPLNNQSIPTEGHISRAVRISGFVMAVLCAGVNWWIFSATPGLAEVQQCL